MKQCCIGKLWNTDFLYFKIQYSEGFKSYFACIKDSRKFEEYCWNIVYCGWNKGTKVPIEVENWKFLEEFKKMIYFTIYDSF